MVTEPSSDQIVLGAVEETKSNAENLDLTWGLRMGRVNDILDSSIQVILDGDTNPVPVLSMLSAPVVKNGRYWVLRIPPSGNYVIGYSSVAEPSSVTSPFDGTTVMTTSAAYVSLVGGASNGVAFVAPQNGRVNVFWRAQLFNDTGTIGKASFTLLSGNVVGSGSAIFASSDQYALQAFSNTSSPEMGTMQLVTGLTPGAPYNVYMQHRRSLGAGNAIFTNRRITVEPAP